MPNMPSTRCDRSHMEVPGPIQRGRTIDSIESEVRCGHANIVQIRPTVGRDGGLATSAVAPLLVNAGRSQACSTVRSVTSDRGGSTVKDQRRSRRLDRYTNLHRYVHGSEVRCPRVPLLRKSPLQVVIKSSSSG